MVTAMSNKWWIALGATVVLCAGGCGGDGEAAVSVNLYGWQNGSFLDTVADYPDAEEIEIRITRPADGEEITSDVFSIADGGAELPELDGGEGVRMDFEVRDGGGDAIAVGATPEFNTGRDDAFSGFRTLVAEPDNFAPVGAMFTGGDGEEWYGETHFDWVSLERPLGRAGHTAHSTESGNVLVVGGARLNSSYEPGHRPDIEHAFNDIQILEVGTGHFTELGGEYGVDDGPVGEDRLDQARAFHTVTPLGDDRFLVAGGFGADGQPISSVELIDLNADDGERVQQLNATLADARGLHTATFRDSDGRVVVAGGLGAGSNDVIGTLEVVDPDSDSVESGTSMSSARVGHAAVLLEDGASVWLIGGRDSGAILDSTELVSADGASATTQSSHRLDRQRYGASAVHLGAAGNNRVLIIGGFSSDSGATGTYELGNPLLLSDIIAGSDFGRTWEIDNARGGATVVQLPQSHDLVVMGGYDNNRSPVGTAERFSIDLEDVDGALSPVDGPESSMLQSRAGYAATLASNGRIALISGVDPSGEELDSAEYFTPYDPVSR